MRFHFGPQTCLCVLILSGSIAFRSAAAITFNDLFVSDVARSLDRQIKDIEKQNNLPSVAVCVLVPGKGRYTFVDGFANLETRTRRTLDEPFRIASITKTFVAKALKDGDPAPAGLSDKEKAAFQSLNYLYKKGGGYAAMMVTRPQTLGYALEDSPIGLAAFFYDKFTEWTYSGGDAEKALTRDEMLDDITLYWLTKTATFSAQLYWENNANNFNAVDISIPAAVTVFPGEIYRAPRSWTERSYHKLIYFNEVDKGGHFAAWEQPELFANEIRAAFRSLR
jgi:pimeloyl-ACP methyl ester carboxylesterase